jgi:tRNA(Ile)-lysidine synthase TilS/MesJ
MRCDMCRCNPVIFQPYSGRNLCREHFIADFEARAKREIRKHQWMRPGDHIAVPHSGDRGSSALLFFLQVLAGRRRDVRISAIPCNRKTPEDREEALCDELAGEIGATRLACAASLDETAVSVLSAIFRGLPETPALDRRKQHRDIGGSLPRIYPFSVIPAEEIVLYARLLGVGSDSSPTEEFPAKFPAGIDVFLDEYSSRHPATKYAIANLGHCLAGCNLYIEGEIS